MPTASEPDGGEVISLTSLLHVTELALLYIRSICGYSCQVHLSYVRVRWNGQFQLFSYQRFPKKVWQAGFRELPSVELSRGTMTNRMIKNIIALCKVPDQALTYCK
jgi:hypothetical protein